jgi:hypothetical protein
MLGSVVHFCIFKNELAKFSRFFFLSFSLIYFCKCQMIPLYDGGPLCASNLHVNTTG